MLDILESFVQKRDYCYIRMDGSTAVASRQPLVAHFNTVCFVSLLVRYNCTMSLPCCCHCHFFLEWFMLFVLIIVHDV